ncbi:hypothetical protein BJ138DRAFT_1123537 [Hygrophoropsis aurantiaca]|uniref:Uncharacterized protein n=1 Tax=Hygrophoropsis aurantiaca TaxID=72124 RepID=A0ACB8AN77_9AGAM|nr:hypothetical protein BJ138DRAFT_1123537 [Hygrophoropsis aurantiaca]
MFGTTRKKNREEDVVPDSEPEREERRQSKRADEYTRKRRRLLQRTEVLQSQLDEVHPGKDNQPLLHPLASPPPAILIDDSPQGEGAEIPHLSPLQNTALLECSPPLQSLDVQGGTERVHLNHLVDEPTHTPIETYIRRRYPTPPPIATMEMTSSFDDDDDAQEGHQLNITHFAFVPPQPQIKQLNSTIKPIESLPSQSIPAPSTAPVTASKIITKNKRTFSNRFANDFPDSEVAKLMKCVGCDTRWTTRKSVAQKMLHLQACTKKHSLSDDTVRVLIRKELAILGKMELEKKNANVEEGTQTTTFLDAVLNPPKKLNKRLKALNTVRALSETRESILGKARSVLGNFAQPQIDSGEAQAFGKSALAGTSRLTVDMPCTQAFGESFLKRRARTMDDGVAREEEPPPPTQCFGVSGFSRRAKTMGIGLFEAQMAPSQLFDPILEIPKPDSGPHDMDAINLHAEGFCSQRSSVEMDELVQTPSPGTSVDSSLLDGHLIPCP